MLRLRAILLGLDKLNPLKDIGLMIDPHAPSHHVLNLAAIGLPTASWLSNAQPLLTAMLTALGIGWYLILYYKAWRNRK